MKNAAHKMDRVDTDGTAFAELHARGGVDAAADNVAAAGRSPLDPPPIALAPEEPIPLDFDPGESEPGVIRHQGGIPHIPPLGPLSRSTVPHTEPARPRSKIRAFEQALETHHGEGRYERRPTASGVGACRVRSFHCKLTGDCLEFMDHQINEWLDQHPDYEIKHVTSAVGDWSGKVREPALIVNVWY